MDFQYFGANCIRVDVGKAGFIVDPSSNSLPKAKKESEKTHILSTGMYPVDNPGNTDYLFLDYPGEYEIGGVAIRGIQTKSHTDVHDSDADSNIIFTLRSSSLSFCILGNPAENLSEEVYEQIGTVDIVALPIGGGGYTLDAKGANKILKQIEPSICIGTHFASYKVNYEVPQDTFNAFFDEVGSGEVVEDNKLKIKTKDLQDSMQVFVFKI